MGCKGILRVRELVPAQDYHDIVPRNAKGHNPLVSVLVVSQYIGVIPPSGRLAYTVATGNL